MRGRFFASVMMLRRQFAALGLLLLTVPLLVNTLPRPSDAARQYISNLAGISICATDPGAIPVKGNPAPSNPCENSVGCAACPAVAMAPATVADILAPSETLGFVQETLIRHGQNWRLAFAHPARAPPFSL